MVIANCVVELSLYGVHSLKDKRSLIKPIIARLPKQFNVAISEVDHHESWNSCVIGIVTIGNDTRYVQGLLEKAVGWIEQHRPETPVADYSIEII